jgi:hypothetical protein
MTIDPEELKRFTTKMVEAVGDMTNHDAVAGWAIRFAIRSYHDGYREGAAAVMKSFLFGALERDLKDGTDPSSEFLKRDAGGGGGASGTSPGPTPEGGSGVPTGKERSWSASRAT